MKIISWNVNGLRAVTKKGDFAKFFKEHDPDVLCLQETKAQETDLNGEHKEDGYYHYFYSAVKKGYAGTAIFSKIKPLAIMRGMGSSEEYEDEGRVLVAEFEQFFVLSVYVVNVQPTLARLALRQKFNDELLAYIKELEKTKPVIVCGDFNVAHQAIDLKNDKANQGKAGFTDEEREKFDQLLAAGYVDTWRHFHPEEIKYSWWSYRFNSRAKNTGWRIDYVVVNKNFLKQVKDTFILNDVLGSDHCPVGVILK